MASNKFNLSGIGPLVEEFELREKAKKYGYILTKDISKTEKLVSVLKALIKLTRELRFKIFSFILISSGWDMFTALMTVYATMITISNHLTTRSKV